MTKNQPFRWGILGPGRIAHKFAKSLPFSRNGILSAVASRNSERGASFAKAYEVPNVFESYEKMVTSGLVDAVYIATPHSFHKENTALCLQNGIPVLCEKPLTENPEDSEYLARLARETRTFLMEGMWTVFLPHFRQSLQWIAEGRIGELIHVQADFGYKAEYDLLDRLYNPDLGGSVTKDVGIYPLSLFYKLLGMPTVVQTAGRRAVTGVDDHVVFQGLFESGKTFQGMVSFLGESNVEAAIVGTEGKIRMSSQWLRPVAALLEAGSVQQKFQPEVPGFGFQFEADEVEQCVREGLIESPHWSLQDSLNVALLISQVEKV